MKIKNPANIYHVSTGVGNMRVAASILAPVIVTAFLTACAQKIWVGKNAESDYYQCQAQASMAYPVAMVTSRVGSGYTSPVNTTCSSSFGTVQCTSTGGNYTPPAEISSDANERGRLAHFGRCMIERGNKYVSKDEAAKYVTPSRTLPPTSKDGCKEEYRPPYKPKICDGK